MQDYTAHRAASVDLTGANADYRVIQPGAEMTLLDADGPGKVTHMWFVQAKSEKFAAKKLVLRAYWDNESEPSVQVTLADFFGEHFGDEKPWTSAMLSVGTDRAMNCFFPMPYRRHARITITNEGAEAVNRFWFNIDYVTFHNALPQDELYFHAAFTQAQPTHGWSDDWKLNNDPVAHDTPNLHGKGNFNWLTATGRGQFVGVVLSVLVNQSEWWGEGDDLFFIDGATTPSIAGTGTEDYFLGSLDWGTTPYTTPLYGAFRLGDESIGSRYTAYRFHLEEPITFERSIVAGIEHGSANVRSDSYYATAYWYQTLPHAPLPPLPPISERIPRLVVVGGPGVKPPSEPFSHGPKP